MTSLTFPRRATWRITCSELYNVYFSSRSKYYFKSCYTFPCGACCYLHETLGQTTVCKNGKANRKHCIITQGITMDADSAYHTNDATCKWFCLSGKVRFVSILECHERRATLNGITVQSYTPAIKIVTKPRHGHPPVCVYGHPPVCIYGHPPVCIYGHPPVCVCGHPPVCLWPSSCVCLWPSSCVCLCTYCLYFEASDHSPSFRTTVSSSPAVSN